jgi:hypothetical protein
VPYKVARLRGTVRKSIPPDGEIVILRRHHPGASAYRLTPAPVRAQLIA